MSPKRWALCTAALLVLMGTGGARMSAAPSKASSRGQGLYQQGLEAAKKHDLATAIRDFRRALEYLPKSPDVHYALGTAYLETGDINRAAIELRKAIALKPDFAEAYFKMAVALNRRNDLNGAIAFYKFAIHVRPDWAAAHDALGSLLAHSGDLAGAQSEFETAIKLKPDLAEAHFHLGTTLWIPGRHHQALSELRKAVSLNPSGAEARYYLQLAERQQGRKALNEAVGSNPAARLASQQAEKDLLNGNLDAAIQEFRAAIQKSPEFARAHYGLAWALRSSGNATEARSEFATAHQLDPGLLEPAD